MKQNAPSMQSGDTPIPFIDLGAQTERLGGRIERAMQRVVDHGSFIMGPEVGQLEERLAGFTGTKHVVTCASGTDALLLLLMAKHIGPGSAVFLPAFTFTATAEVVALLGATPVFVDVDPETFLIDLDSLRDAVRHVSNTGLDPAAVIVVDLFGQPADYIAVNQFAHEHDLFVVEDAAQSFGASFAGQAACGLTHAAATSFFPAKPLSCFGDGGAVFTNDDSLAATCRSLRAHGKSTHKYDIERVGLNSRLDTIQAAVLLEKLNIFDEEVAARNRIADLYTRGLSSLCSTPRTAAGATSVWAQYTLRLPDRESVASCLAKQGIPTNVYYPKTLNQQKAYADFPVSPSGVGTAERLTGEVLSLPMHPYLDEPDQSRIIDAVLAAL